MGWIKEKIVEWLKKESNREKQYYISVEYIRQFETPFLHYNILRGREVRI